MNLFDAAPTPSPVQSGTTRLEKAVVKTVTFHNPDNGYSVLKLQVQGQNQSITAVGNLPRLAPGEWLEVQGEWAQHETFGPQFKIQGYTLLPPDNLEGIKRYLGGGSIKGVGEILANKIVNAFGADTFRILDEEPDRLSEIPGMKGRKRNSILAAWRDSRGLRDILYFLQAHKLSLNLSQRIHKHYGARAIEKLKENPYQLAEELWGIGFLKADEIATKLGFPSDSYERLRAGIQYALARSCEDGHVFLKEEELLARAEELLKAPRERIQFALDYLLEIEAILTEDKLRYYVPWLYHAERGIARRLSLLLGSLKALPKGVVEKAITQVEAKTGKGFVFSLEQKKGIEQAVNQGVFLLTGGPGTGKTTTVQGILEVFREGGLDVKLCAPTGRAAQRLNEVTGFSASTIHRLLKNDPEGKGFIHNDTLPLPIDVLIVDELSMMDTSLMFSLLKAIKPGTRLILVGDPHQLPSVGPGKVLAEIIASQKVPHLHLSKIFRQAESSLIVTNAHRIQRGELPERKEEANFHMVMRDSVETALEAIVEIATERLPRRFGFDARDEVQVLTPMNQGALGTIVLNQALQAKLNPQARELLFKEKRYRVGDKIMQLKNNYEKSVFNGDIGKVISINPSERKLSAEFDAGLIEYEGEELDQLNLAYAISIHKSQGSEFKAVVLAFSRVHWVMLQRNLLYTAITRAREQCVVVGQPEAIRHAVQNNPAISRNTALADAIRRELSQLAFE